MPVCTVCSSPAPFSCARCKCVSYCSPAHQKEDWKAHKVQCLRLAQKAATVFKSCDEELLLRITTCLAQNGYHKEVGIMVQLNKAFWNDEQIWDAFKDVPGGGPKGRTRLLYSAAKGNLKRLRFLLDRGARVDKGCAGDGFTAIMGASQNGYLEIVRELCKRGANVNAARTCDGFTPLMWASQEGHVDVICELCGRGAKVNAAAYGNFLTALIAASFKGHLPAVRALLNFGANKLYENSFGKTAHFFASGASKEALQVLLKP
jgi:hypothetical protein